MYDSETIAALQSGAIVVRDLLTVHGKTLGGTPTDFCYWTGEDAVAINVQPLDGGSPESRNFVGSATLLDVPPIVDAVGFEARSITIGLDHTSVAAGSPMDMVFGNNVRVARLELHRALFDPATWHLVSTAHLLFAGRVDGAAVDDASAGGEGGLSIEAVQAAIDLTKTNPAMESHEQQKLREGDTFRQYGDTAAQVEAYWGQQKA